MNDIKLIKHLIRITWVFILFGLALHGCATSNTSGVGNNDRASNSANLVLQKANGTIVEVPRTGALSDQRALALAQSIIDFDDRRSGRDPFDNISDPDLRNTVTEMATTMRDDAVDKIDLAYRVARTTSSGLNGNLLTQGQELMSNVKKLLHRPPTKLYVRTQITSRVDGASIHYMSSSDYRKQSDDWMGYTFGQRIKIGVYVFRLQRNTGVGDPRFQKLEIMEDPLIRMLNPTGRM
jgi:hypothetical protein